MHVWFCMSWSIECSNLQWQEPDSCRSFTMLVKGSLVNRSKKSSGTPISKQLNESHSIYTACMFWGQPCTTSWPDMFHDIMIAMASKR